MVSFGVVPSQPLIPLGASQLDKSAAPQFSISTPFHSAAYPIETGLRHCKRRKWRIVRLFVSGFVQRHGCLG